MYDSEIKGIAYELEREEAVSVAIYAMAYCADKTTQLNHLKLGRRGLAKLYCLLDAASLAVG